MILSGERMSASDAAQIGLINEAVPSDLDACVSKWANLLADRPPEVMKLDYAPIMLKTTYPWRMHCPTRNSITCSHGYERCTEGSNGFP